MSSVGLPNQVFQCANTITNNLYGMFVSGIKLNNYLVYNWRMTSFNSSSGGEGCRVGSILGVYKCCGHRPQQSVVTTNNLFMTTQMLWPLSTMTCGAQWPQIASL